MFWWLSPGHARAVLHVLCPLPHRHYTQTTKTPKQGVFRLLKARSFVKEGDLVVLVSDLRPSEDDIIRSVQMRRVQ